MADEQEEGLENKSLLSWNKMKATKVLLISDFTPKRDYTFPEKVGVE